LLAALWRGLAKAHKRSNTPKRLKIGFVQNCAKNLVRLLALKKSVTNMKHTFLWSVTRKKESHRRQKREGWQLWAWADLLARLISHTCHQRLHQPLLRLGQRD
jgi:hypothetical protein